MNLVESFRHWTEAESLSDPNYVQKEYEAFFIFTIAKARGGDKTETLSEIREIPGVTIVSKSGDLSDQPTFYKGLFKIKFTQEGNETPDIYLADVLRPGLEQIEGLRVTEYKGYNEVGKDRL